MVDDQFGSVRGNDNHPQTSNDCILQSELGQDAQSSKPMPIVDEASVLQPIPGTTTCDITADTKPNID